MGDNGFGWEIWGIDIMEKKKIILGDTASFSKTITEYDVYTFAGVTGDFNPVHINEDAAKKSVFGKRIAHGMFTGSLISTVLGTKLPGEGTIYLEQELKFKKPVFINDTITAKVTVSEIINAEKGIYRLTTEVVRGEDVVSEGYAVVKYC